MLFQAPVISAEEEEVIDEIETIRKQLHIPGPRLQEWPGLPWRAIHAQAMQPVSEDAGAADAKVPAALSADVAGYRAALTFALQLADMRDFQYDEGSFRALHYLMLSHDPSKSPGQWRRDAMSVRRDPSADFLFKRDTANDILYKAPHPTAVPQLMATLIASLNAGDDNSVLIRAAMAHLNLAAIHPFADGNGRMARALHTLVLAREGISLPAFASIDEYLSVHSTEYEQVLRQVQGGAWQPSRDTRPWIRFCLRAHWIQARTLLRLTREYDRLWDTLEQEVRQRGLPARTIFALTQAALGSRVQCAEYESTAGVSAQAASRDLRRLAEAGLLVATNGKRRTVLSCRRAGERDLRAHPRAAGCGRRPVCNARRSGIKPPTVSVGCVPLTSYDDTVSRPASSLFIASLRRGAGNAPDACS